MRYQPSRTTDRWRVFFSFTGTYVWVCSITSNASHPDWLIVLIELPVPTYGYVLSHHIKRSRVDRRCPKGLRPDRPPSIDLLVYRVDVVTGKTRTLNFNHQCVCFVVHAGSIPDIAKPSPGDVSEGAKGSVARERLRPRTTGSTAEQDARASESGNHVSSYVRSDTVLLVGLHGVRMRPSSEVRARAMPLRCAKGRFVSTLWWSRPFGALDGGA